MRARTAALLVVPFALTSFLAANAYSGERNDGTPSTLVANLEKITATGNWQELSKAARASGERLARSEHRDAIPYGRIAAYHALAHFRLGETREALWHWQVALNLSSDVAIAEIAKFPDAAEAFAKTGLPSIQLQSGPSIRPARPKKTARPAVPAFADPRRPSAAFGVRLIVGMDGVPHSPRVIGDFRDEADRVYSALVALHEWRFVPATAEGVPVEFPMSISLDIGGAGKRQLPRGRRF